MRTVVLLVLAACDGPSDKPADDTGTPDPNEAPGAPTVELSPGGPTTVDDLRVVVVSDAADPDGDAVTYSYLWFRDGTLVEDQVGDTVPAAVTTKGEAWRVLVVANDGALDGAPAEAEVTILNTPPVATVAVAPEAPLTVDDLVATASAEDADGDTVAYTYVWSVDGVASGYTGETLPADATTKGETWTVTVTPDDGEEQGEAVAYDVTVGNTAPAITTVTLDPAEVRAGTEVACVPSGWADADGDAEAYTYAWYRNGAYVAATPTLSGFVSGDTLSCEATPTDGTDVGATVASETTTVLNTAPSIDAATLSTLTPVEADTLSVTIEGAYDIDGDEISYAYDWYVDGVWVSDAETIDGTLFAKGDTVYVEVTPYDYADTGAMVTSDVATVANTAPVVNVVSLSPSSVYTNDTLTASVIASDADDDALTYTYSWTVNGATIAATGSTLSGATWFDRDDVVTVTATPDDGADTGTSATSSSVTVLNTPPGAPAVSISPSEPGNGDDLVCSVTTAATDADGDTLTYSFDWTLDGAAYTGSTTSTATSDTVPASATSGDEVWACTVTADDGTDAGTSASDSVTVSAGVGPWLYVTDYGTNRVFRVDVGADTIELLFEDSRLDTPRGIAVDDDGYLYVAQREGDQGVVRFTTDGTWVDQFLSGPYGSYGPGLLRYDDGDLFVAGDTGGSGSIYRYDVSTGALVHSFNYSGTTTVLGLHVEGSYVWAVGYFAKTIVRYDISGSSVTSSRISTSLDNRSLGITRGHDGNLYVCDHDGYYIYEYNASTGSRVGTFATMSSSQTDIYYDSVSNSYFVTTGTSIVQLDTSGSTVNSWTHSDLTSPAGLAVTYTEW